MSVTTFSISPNVFKKVFVSEVPLATVNSKWNNLPTHYSFKISLVAT